MLIIVNDKICGRRLKLLFIKDTFTLTEDRRGAHISDELAEYLLNRFNIILRTVDFITFDKGATILGNTIETFGMLRLCTVLNKPDGYEEEMLDYREGAEFFHFPQLDKQYRTYDECHLVDGHKYYLCRGVIWPEDAFDFMEDANELNYDFPGVPYDLSTVFSDYPINLKGKHPWYPAGFNNIIIYHHIRDIINNYYRDNQQ